MFVGEAAFEIPRSLLPATPDAHHVLWPDFDPRGIAVRFSGVLMNLVDTAPHLVWGEAGRQPSIAYSPSPSQNTRRVAPHPQRERFLLWFWIHLDLVEFYELAIIAGRRFGQEDAKRFYGLVHQVTPSFVRPARM